MRTIASIYLRGGNPTIHRMLGRSLKVGFVGVRMEPYWGCNGCHGWSTYPPPKRTILRNTGLIAGLIKGNQWFS